MFGKAEYVTLKRSLSFEPSTAITLLVWTGTITLVGLALLMLRAGGRGAYLLSQLLLVTAFFQSFALLHECGHGSAFSRPWMNTVFGHLASVLCFLPYFPWKFIHQAHHVWTGNVDRDPTMRALRVWRERGKVPGPVSFGWRSWIPIMAVFQHVVFWTYPLRLLQARGVSRGQLLRCASSVAFLAGAYLVVAQVQPGLLTFTNFGPALVTYLVVVELVNLPHHVGMPTHEGRLPLWEQWVTTRSCYYPPVVSEFFTLNFNFHTEHHLFPALPWYRLRRARRLLKEVAGRSYHEERGVSWNLSRRRRPFAQIVLGTDPPPPSSV